MPKECMQLVADLRMRLQTKEDDVRLVNKVDNRLVASFLFVRQARRLE